MGQRIYWTERARAQLRAIDQETAMQILHALARLIAMGEGDVKRLQDIAPTEYRLRVGDYRLLFHDLGKGVEVIAVKHRREAYR